MGSIHLVHSKDSKSPYSTGHVNCVPCNSITDMKHDLARTGSGITHLQNYSKAA